MRATVEIQITVAPESCPYSTRNAAERPKTKGNKKPSQIAGFCCIVDGVERVRTRMWWPETGSNRRRWPFQGWSRPSRPYTGRYWRSRVASHKRPDARCRTPNSRRLHDAVRIAQPGLETIEGQDQLPPIRPERHLRRRSFANIRPVKWVGCIAWLSVTAKSCQPLRPGALRS